MVEKTEQIIEQLKNYIKKLESQNSDLKRKLIRSEKINDEILSYGDKHEQISINGYVDASHMNDKHILESFKENLSHSLFDEVKKHILFSVSDQSVFDPLYSSHLIRATLFIKKKIDDTKK